MELEIKNHIEFDDLRNIINIRDENAFQLYVNDIYKELENKKKSSKGHYGISKNSFFSFLKLPVFICTLSKHYSSGVTLTKIQN